MFSWQAKRHTVTVLLLDCLFGCAFGNALVNLDRFCVSFTYVIGVHCLHWWSCKHTFSTICLFGVGRTCTRMFETTEYGVFECCRFESTVKMRSSRAQKPKETNKQKKERKREFLENKKNVVSVVLPTLVVVFALITLFIYLKVHPNALNFMASEKSL